LAGSPWTAEHYQRSPTQAMNQQAYAEPWAVRAGLVAEVGERE